MRKIMSFVLLALGAALLAIGVVTTTWAPGQVKQTPLDVDTTTRLEGTAARLGDEARPVKVTSVTRTDSEASDDAVAVFVSVSCVVYTDAGEVPDCGDQTAETDQTGETDEGGDPRVLTIGIDKFATDRETALAVDEAGFVPEADIVGHEGVINKFPFDTGQESYPYWDGLTGQAWPAEFVGEEDLDGLSTYRFSVSIQNAEAEVIPDTEGTYSNQIDIWVEPETGGIVRQSQDQQRLIDGEEVLTLQADYTQEQQELSIAEAKDNLAQLQLVTKTLPLAGFIGGGLLLLAGTALFLTARRRDDDADIAVTHRDPVPAGR